MSFDRDWTISPGETLKDWIEENGLTVRSTARTCRLEPDEIEGIMSAEIKLDEFFAQHLASGTGIPARLWLNLERSYREDLAAGRTDFSKRG